jgi:sugar lactone lactonase YvrE
MTTLSTVLDKGHFFEGARWHDGRLWVSDFFGHQVVSTDTRDEVTLEAVVDSQPSGLGWLPGGELLVVSMLDKKLLRREPAGTLVEVADISAEARGSQANDMVVDGSGRAYISVLGFDPYVGQPISRAPLIRVDPDGAVAVVAEDLEMPNGLAILDGDVLVVAETLGNRLSAFDIRADGSLGARRDWAVFGPPRSTDDLMTSMGEIRVGADGIVADSLGGVWVADSLHNRAVRVEEGGLVTDEVPTGDFGCYSCALGGAQGDTLFLCVAPDFSAELRSASTESHVVAAVVDVPA